LAKVHKTAIVDKDAILADDVEVGPYCLIGPEVWVGPGTKIGPHCVIHRWTSMGRNNNLVLSCSVGADPQDLKYKGEKTFLEIGDNNIIREYVTLNRATGVGQKTQIGSNNLFMATSHVGHNCIIGNNNVMANAVAIGGHVVIEDNTIMGGLAGIHQFCRIGKFAIMGGCSKAIQDVPPYSMCDGDPARIFGLNKIGLDRAGISKDAQAALKKAFKILFHEGLLISNAVKKVEQEVLQTEEVKYLLDFVKSSERGVCHWTRSDL
jgi:UDP-N-acetylglucosamine acyltransferase